MSSPRITPASLGKLPIALTLPDELWIKILLELDYFEVKKMRRVCKKLQRFTQVSRDRVISIATLLTLLSVRRIASSTRPSSALHLYLPRS